MSIETIATETAAEVALVSGSSTHVQQSRLGPPFYDPWKIYQGPKPHGFFCRTMLDSYTGQMWAEMGAEPHPPSTGLTIGWCWWGFKRLNLRFYTPGRLIAVVRPTQISVVHNGGNWVPKASLSLHKGRTLIEENIRNLYMGQDTVVSVRVPQPGHYDVSVGGSVRAVYSGSASPYGVVDARILGLFFLPFGALQPAELEQAAGEDAAADAMPVHADENLEPSTAELEAQQQALADSELRDLGTVQEIREAGLIEL